MDQKSNNADFVTLLTSHQQRLAVFVRSLVPRRADADEVLQNVNLFLWQHAEEFVPGTNFTTWAYRVAHFEVLSYRKRSARERERFSDTTVEQLVDEATRALDVVSDLYHDALEICLQKLSERDRQIIALRYEAGTSPQSVAERMGRSSKAIYESLDRIRSRLLDCIGRTLAAEERTS